jgi:hypothetical protein
MFQRVIVVTFVIGPVIAAVLLAWPHPRLQPVVQPQAPTASEASVAAPPDFPRAVLATVPPDEQVKEEADVLLTEVNRLLRLADKLDSEIDRLMQQIHEPSDGAVSLPDAALPERGSVPQHHENLHAESRSRSAELLMQQHATANQAEQAPFSFIHIDQPEELAFVEAEKTALVGPPELVATVQAGTSVVVVPPPAERPAQLASGEGVIRSFTTPPAMSARLRAGSEAVGNRLYQMPRATASSIAQRRCQFVTLRAQLGEELSNADQLFLKAGCR